MNRWPECCRSDDRGTDPIAEWVEEERLMLNIPLS